MRGRLLADGGSSVPLQYSPESETFTRSPLLSGQVAETLVSVIVALVLLVTLQLALVVCSSLMSEQSGVGVLVGTGVSVGIGVLVGTGVSPGADVLVGTGVSPGADVLVGTDVSPGADVLVGTGVSSGS